MNQSLETQKQGDSHSVENWFDNIVATIRTHELQLNTDTASPEIEQMYRVLMSNNIEQIARTNRLQSNIYFVTQMVIKYMSLLGEKKPNKLAFAFNDSEVLVWAEIDTDDEEMEKRLFLVEAEVNAHFHQFGYDIVTTIVEVDDCQDVPNHYRAI